MTQQTSIASRLHIGRIVRFFGGYGSIDGMGAIVAVHGTPNPAPAQPMPGGVCRFIRQTDCTIDVILFDGRRLSAVNQCGIDAPGIGVKLTQETIADVSHLPGLAAEREATAATAKAQARAKFEAGEAARIIPNPPLFYFNGIKDARGEKLQKCSYSMCELRSYPAGTITIYARDYCHFSDCVFACFAVENDTDTQTDYFDSDNIRVIPSHPLYQRVLAAQQASAAKFADRLAKPIA